MFSDFWLLPLFLSFDPKCKGKFRGLKQHFQSKMIKFHRISRTGKAVQGLSSPIIKTNNLELTHWAKESFCHSFVIVIVPDMILVLSWAEQRQLKDWSCLAIIRPWTLLLFCAAGALCAVATASYIMVYWLAICHKNWLLNKRVPVQGAPLL